MFFGSLRLIGCWLSSGVCMMLWFVVLFICVFWSFFESMS